MSLNDPNWGRGGSRGPQGPGGGNQGPPDLDELWRNFNRRLSELFRRRARGSGDEPPRPPSARGIGGGAGAPLVLVLAGGVGGGFFILRGRPAGRRPALRPVAQGTRPGAPPRGAP